MIYLSLLIKCLKATRDITFRKMNVIIDFNRSLYIFDYIRYLFYDFIGNFEKIIILLFLLTILISMLNYVELISFYPSYINTARDISLIFISLYFGVEIIKISILGYKFNKRLKNINTDKFKLKIDKSKLILYAHNNDILKSIDLNNLSTIQYLRPTLYLIDINENVFFIINERKVRTNNFHQIIDFFKSRNGYK